jgi:transcriptional regulator with PAS, ATPase and Fis domain
LGELSLNNQAKLLRVLQDKVIEQVGSTKSKKIDCRIVAATNAKLQELVKQKKFRDDLYFRIATAVIELPPLRARSSDIPKLALHFLDQINQRHRFKKPRVLAPDTLTYLTSHDWPGNVRELASAIENAAIQTSQGKIEPKHFGLRRTGTTQTMESLPDPHDGFSLEGFLGQIRSHLYARALELSGGNASKAAKLLNVTPQAVAKAARASDTTKVHKK